MAALRRDTLQITLKFNFMERIVEYNLSTNNRTYDILNNLRLDAEHFVYNVSQAAAKLSSYTLLLYRLDEQTPYLHLITNPYDLEHECTIEIIPVRCSQTPRCILQEKAFSTPHSCGKCSKFIVGEMLTNVRVCNKCQTAYHQSCAPTFSHQCTNNQVKPPAVPPRHKINNGRLARTSVKNPSCALPKHQWIDNAYLLYFIKNENIYRRGHFLVTQSGVTIDSYPMIAFDSLQSVRYVYDQRQNHTFEMMCKDGTIICIGYRSIPSSITDEIRMLTDQFCSHVHLKWESMVVTAAATAAIPSFQGRCAVRLTPEQCLARKQQQKLPPPLPSPPIYYQYGPEGESNDTMQELYEFTHEKIGQGGFGSVEGAIRRSTREKLAVKRIDYTTWQAGGGTTGEIDILCHLKHPGILKFEACFARREGLYIFMERMQSDLYEYISKQPNTGRLTEATSKFIIFQVLVAVSYLHEKNISHCDIKPENLLLNILPTTINTSCEHVKLADFGYSRFIRDASLRRTQVGTAPYMAPELYHSFERGYNKSADLWAVGIVLYACLTGTIPFQANELDTAEILVNDVDYMYPDRDWRHFSIEAKTFLSQHLLVPDPTRRTKAIRSLNNEWFVHDQKLQDSLKELETMVKSSDVEPCWLSKYFTS